MQAQTLRTKQPVTETAYNDLQEVGIANRALWSRDGRQAFFEEIGSLICDHGLEDHVGLCLLHSHNDLEPDHIMVESFEADTYPTPAMVMAHVTADSVTAPVPVAMQVCGDSLLPLEYSSVDLARTNYQALETAGDDFVHAFTKMVHSHGFENLVGLSVLRVAALDRQPGEELIERTDYDRVANVLRAHDTVEREGVQHVQTSWKFEAADATSGSKCVTKCLATCVTKCEAPNAPGDPHIEENHVEKHKGSGSHIPPR